jgi:hypothetical protein
MNEVERSSRPVVRRLRRYGHDRAYVKLGDRDIGYRDLTTGDVRCKRSEHTETVETSTAELWEQVQEAIRMAYQPRHAAPEDEPAPVPV